MGRHERLVQLLALEVNVVGRGFISCTVACGSGHDALWGDQLGWSGRGAL